MNPDNPNLRTADEWSDRYDELRAENQRLRAALESIIAKSHSWLITQKTGPIEKPIHDSYREIARKALEGK